MNNTLLLHNLLRWAILLFGVWSVFAAISGVISKRNYGKSDNLSSLFFMLSCDVQLLVGLVLYFYNSYFSQLTTNTKQVMGNSLLRFFALEHSLMMIIAWLLVHIGRSSVKRAGTDAQKHKRTLIYFGIALVIILAMIPWPFRQLGIGRPLFPQF